MKLTKTKERSELLKKQKRKLKSKSKAADLFKYISESRDEQDFSKIISSDEESNNGNSSVQSASGQSVRSLSSAALYFDGEIFGSSTSDTRNMEVCISDHGDVPESVMKVVIYDNIPMVKKPDEIIVRVEASTISREDCAMRLGTFQWQIGARPSLPMVPGLDCVGTVISCGGDVKGVEIGTRVAALVSHGACSRYMRIPSSDIVKIPDGVSSENAASMIRVYMSAFQAIASVVTSPDERYKTQFLNGKRVLVVGKGAIEDRAAIDIAMALGAARVYLPCESDQKLNVRRMGAKPLPKEPGKWIDYVENKIDIAIDNVGTDSFFYTRQALNKYGHLAATGMSDVEDCEKDMISQIERGWNLFLLQILPHTSFYYGAIESFRQNKELYLADLKYLLKLLGHGWLRPKIGPKIGFEKVPLAHKRMDYDKNDTESRGLIIVDPWKVQRRKSS